MDNSLHPVARILLAVWAVVTIPGGLLLIFYEPFATMLVWPDPLEVIPLFHAQLNGAIGLGTGAAALLALRRNSWEAARPVIGMFVLYAIAAEYVALTRIAAGPVPAQIWLYVILGLGYLGGSIVVWRSDEGRP